MRSLLESKQLRVFEAELQNWIRKFPYAVLQPSPSHSL